MANTRTVFLKKSLERCGSVVQVSEIQVVLEEEIAIKTSPLQLVGTKPQVKFSIELTEMNNTTPIISINILGTTATKKKTYGDSATSTVTPVSNVELVQDQNTSVRVEIVPLRYRRAGGREIEWMGSSEEVVISRSDVAFELIEKFESQMHGPPIDSSDDESLLEVCNSLFKDLDSCLKTYGTPGLVQTSVCARRASTPNTTLATPESITAMNRRLLLSQKKEEFRKYKEFKLLSHSITHGLYLSALEKLPSRRSGRVAAISNIVVSGPSNADEVQPDEIDVISSDESDEDRSKNFYYKIRRRSSKSTSDFVADSYQAKPAAACRELEEIRKRKASNSRLKKSNVIKISDSFYKCSICGFSSRHHSTVWNHHKRVHKKRAK